MSRVQGSEASGIQRWALGSSRMTEMHFGGMGRSTGDWSFCNINIDTSKKDMLKGLIGLPAASLIKSTDCLSLGKCSILLLPLPFLMFFECLSA